MPAINRRFSAIRCSCISTYTALRFSKINGFWRGLANCKQTLGEEGEEKIFMLCIQTKNDSEIGLQIKNQPIEQTYPQLTAHEITQLKNQDAVMPIHSVENI